MPLLSAAVPVPVLSAAVLVLSAAVLVLSAAVLVLSAAVLVLSAAVLVLSAAVLVLENRRIAWTDNAKELRFKPLSFDPRMNVLCSARISSTSMSMRTNPVCGVSQSRKRNGLKPRCLRFRSRKIYSLMDQSKPA